MLIEYLLKQIYCCVKIILNLADAQQLSKNVKKEINGGTFSTSTQSCSNNQPTGFVWENATGCCYNFMMEL